DRFVQSTRRRVGIISPTIETSGHEEASGPPGPIGTGKRYDSIESAPRSAAEPHSRCPCREHFRLSHSVSEDLSAQSPVCVTLPQVALKAGIVSRFACDPTGAANTARWIVTYDSQ